MAQLATVLPTDFLLAADGGPTYVTTVFDGSTGIEVRNKVWPSGRHAWTLTYGGLLSEIQPVLDLFDDASGMHLSFPFTPPGYSEMDFRFASDECKPALQPSGVPGEYIATVTLSIIQVLDE